MMFEAKRELVYGRTNLALVIYTYLYLIKMLWSVCKVKVGT